MEPEVWFQFQNALRKRVGSVSYKRWLSQLSPVEVLSHKAVLCCPNKFVLDWVKLNYYKDIASSLTQVLGNELSVELLLSKADHQESPPRNRTPRQLMLPGTERYLCGLPLINREYTFQNFVVGPSNHFAYASALAVAEGAPRLYNPLFFYSSAGLGKTHLSSAMGQKIATDNPDVKVYYTTAEWFTHEMIQALRKNRIPEFKETYRQKCDVLVVEDVQFFQGKEKTQEEIFYTLDTLIHMGKQVVLTANSSPREISDLKDNLKSRMGGGLVVDIKAPDYETKRKIIARKCAEENLDLPEEVADFIANAIKSNIRDIKSAIIQLIAAASLLGRRIDLDLARETLKDIIQKRAVTIGEIQKFIARHFKLSPEQLQSKARARSVAFPRQLAYYFCRQYTDITLAAIGKHFNRNHSSVLRSLTHLEMSMRTNRGVKDTVSFLTEKFEKSYC